MLTLKEIKTNPEYYKMPENTLSSINNYIVYGIEPGSFLMSVLQNDLKRSFAKADKHNREAMFEIVKYLYNEVPIVAWGSEEKVKAWLESKNQKEE